MKRCGSRSRYQRSLKVPGSPSSMLIAHSRGAGSAATDFHCVRGKARTAESAKAGILHDRDHLFALPRSVDAGLGELVPAFRAYAA